MACRLSAVVGGGPVAFAARAGGNGGVGNRGLAVEFGLDEIALELAVERSPMIAVTNHKGSWTMLQIMTPMVSGTAHSRM